MTTPEQRSLDALRRFDRPHTPTPAALERIERAMLDRFDATLDEGPAVEVVELAPVEAGRVGRAPIGRGLLAAAAVVVFVAGLVVFTSWRADDAQDPTTEPSVSAPDLALIGEQLQSYCTAFLPAVDAAAAQFDSGLGSEQSRLDALIAVEQAAQGLADLPPPAARTIAGDAQRLLDATAEARLAVSIEVDENDGVVAALAALDDAIRRLAAPVDAPACERP